MGQYHIGIGEGRGRSQWDSGVLGDVHVERLSRIDTFVGGKMKEERGKSWSPTLCMPITAIKRHKHFRIPQSQNPHDVENSGWD